ncbi:NAD(P)H-dependent oxidoreductase [Halomonas sp. SpR1]|uniref:FMN-dependent NADH-azoreductase n=1 Tax=Halomonas sp. SpR1 TaxID=3050462 RepID=UPI0027E56468|nr:NAD(P)H-dependent oxidoreductase [Halomonas sp. SpR1]MDQ7734220.1 NAD(P)H-dependent oxidoreductase [Halomonas sp. SpR1]
MTTLLVIEASPRGEHSVSHNMTRRFVRGWVAAHPDGTVINRNLLDTGLRFVDAAWLQAYFTPPDKQSPEMADALQLSDELVTELLAADHLVIATPVYNYNVPAVLKAWVDHIVRKGLTLGFDGSGLATGKKATVLMASGGIYTAGSPLQDRDIASQYLRLILNVIGISDVTLVAGGGAKAVDLGEETMQGFVEKLGGQLERAANA